MDENRQGKRRDLLKVRLAGKAGPDLHAVVVELPGEAGGACLLRFEPWSRVSLIADTTNSYSATACSLIQTGTSPVP